jgi:hypothetical protein
MELRARVVRLALVGYAAVETVRGAVPEVVAVAAAVAVEVGVSAFALSTVLQAGFLFVALYVFTPTVFPAAVGARRETVGFRTVAALVGLAYALPTTLALTTFDDITVSYMVVGGYLAVATVGGAAAFALYFAWTQSAALADPAGDAVAILLGRTDESPAEHRAQVHQLDATAPLVGRLVRPLSVIAAMSTYVGPALVFGVAAGTLDSLFPLLEALVVASLLLQAGRRAGVVDRSLPDVESRFYDRLTTATRSVRGTVGVIMTVVGILLAAFLVLVWVQLGAGLAEVANAVRGLATSLDGGPLGEPLPAATIELTAALGGTIALPLASGYAVWHWSRELRRITRLEGDGDGDASAGDGDGAADGGDGAVVTRPPDMLVAATLLTVAWFVDLTAFRFDGAIEPAFAVVWPVLAVVLLAHVCQSRAGDQSPPVESAWTLPAAYVVYGTGVTGSLAIAFDLRASMVLAVVLPLWMYYLPHVSDRATDVTGRLGLVAYSVGLVLPLAALQGPLELGTPTLAFIGGTVALLLVGHVLSHRYERGPAFDK